MTNTDIIVNVLRGTTNTPVDIRVIAQRINKELRKAVK